jgi:hypothetical protein
VNNLALFICGLAITLLSGLGVIVYMASLGYDKKKKTVESDEVKKLEIKEPSVMDSFVGIPSAS